MVKAKSSSRGGNRRGSPEAIEKRRVARMFNELMGGHGSLIQKLDGRTEKRRQRLLKELEEGHSHGSKDLKPLDVLQRVQELLELGERVSSIRKVCKIPKSKLTNEGIIELIHRLHNAYGFRPEAYRFIGISDETLGEAGVLQREAAKKPPRRKRLG